MTVLPRNKGSDVLSDQREASVTRAAPSHSLTEAKTLTAARLGGGSGDTDRVEAGMPPGELRAAAEPLQVGPEDTPSNRTTT